MLDCIHAFPVPHTALLQLGSTTVISEVNSRANNPFLWVSFITVNKEEHGWPFNLANPKTWQERVISFFSALAKRRPEPEVLQFSPRLHVQIEINQISGQILRLGIENIDMSRPQHRCRLASFIGQKVGAGKSE